MIQTVRDLRGDEIMARDGAIGSVDDVYFDDERWAVRYLVVDTGSWLPGKRVLISPAVVDGAISNPAVVHLELTREQVQNAPEERSDLPISRQYEKALAAYFGYPPYWAGPMLWGRTPLPARGQPPAEAAELEAIREGRQGILDGDPHLRSCAEVIGYSIEARDGSIGEVQDFVIDEGTWAIRDVVVDTMKWWPGGHVRVHPEYVERIDWGERRMHLRLTRDEVKRAGTSGPG
jgi:sporulation protein YlmC with PRC-barrel domain